MSDRENCTICGKKLYGGDNQVMYLESPIHSMHRFQHLECRLSVERAKAIEECATIVDAVRMEFVAAGAEIVESGMAHEIMPEAVAGNLQDIAAAIRSLNREKTSP
jgi:hypothetical protein